MERYEAALGECRFGLLCAMSASALLVCGVALLIFR